MAVETRMKSSNDFTGGNRNVSRPLKKKYGVKVVKKSFKKLGEDARAIPDEAAQRGLGAEESEHPGWESHQPGNPERGEDSIWL